MNIPDVDLSRFDLKHIRVLVSEAIVPSGGLAAFEVRVVLGAKDVCDGTKQTVVVRDFIYMDRLARSERPAVLFGSFVRTLIINALTHEVDECLFLDGKRLCANPHPELEQHAKERLRL